MEVPVANAINRTIDEYAPDLLKKEFGSMEKRILDMRVCDLRRKVPRVLPKCWIC